jgi:hypothetical protein
MFVVVMVLGLVVIVLWVFLVDGLIIVEALASVAPIYRALPGLPIALSNNH